MQILEDNIEDFGDVAKRIIALREKVIELLENRDIQAGEVNSVHNTELVQEIAILKKELEGKDKKIKDLNLSEVSSGNNTSLVQEITILKKELEGKEKKINDLKLNEVNSKNDTALVEEINSLKKQLKEKENNVTGFATKKVVSGNSEELVQENDLLKKQLKDREKTIKELGFKLEMFKMARSLREGAGISTKSEELKKMITEYIKEIDKSITSLNIE